MNPDLLVDGDERGELRSSVRRLLRDKAPLVALRDDPAFDRGLWRRLAELGLVGLAVPEKYGGLGQTAAETGVVFEEMGRALYRGPYLSCVGLAVPALLSSGDDAACAELLPAIVAGDCVATLAVSAGREGARNAETRAVAEDGGWLLTGTEPFVLDGADADLILVTAVSGGDPVSGDDRHSVTRHSRALEGRSLYAVRADAPGATRTPAESLDLARAVAAVTLDRAPARLIGTAGAAPPVVARALDTALVGLAMEQAGGASACLEMVVEYTKTRRQFDRVIGSFQAVAHKAVDMLRRVEFSRSAARYAAAALAEDDPEFPVAVRVAAAYCGDAFREVVAETVQLHGGIGFTWEHDTHLYYRRAWSSQQLLGPTDTHYAEVATRIGL
ncbi:acyl-CoA dehydrogenase family protein [Pseudonocardia eucalypti]|uniref:Acyl-CoA dehydrogenase family protein n=1 Tax=Pseudonocardia eucalypti TaxID=648755 RepID=A0ABP9Q2H0_9PSEU|nr:alkylation response protein AidB-like acyl-CoA dehydrogenase [Pseudonocardia eucalypti]